MNWTIIRLVTQKRKHFSTKNILFSSYKINVLTVVRFEHENPLAKFLKLTNNSFQKFSANVSWRNSRSQVQVAHCRIKSSWVSPHVHLRQSSVGQLFSRLGLCYLNGKDFNQRRPLKSTCRLICYFAKFQGTWHFNLTVRIRIWFILKKFVF